MTIPGRISPSCIALMFSTSASDPSDISSIVGKSWMPSIEDGPKSNPGPMILSSERPRAQGYSQRSGIIAVVKESSFQPFVVSCLPRVLTWFELTVIGLQHHRLARLFLLDYRIKCGNITPDVKFKLEVGQEHFQEHRPSEQPLIANSLTRKAFGIMSARSAALGVATSGRLLACSLHAWQSQHVSRPVSVHGPSLSTGNIFS
jgi:hypothetical protein